MAGKPRFFLKTRTAEMRLPTGLKKFPAAYTK
jgi:hypothetical protein